MCDFLMHPLFKFALACDFCAFYVSFAVNIYLSSTVVYITAKIALTFGNITF